LNVRHCQHHFLASLENTNTKMFNYRPRDLYLAGATAIKCTMKFIEHRNHWSHSGDTKHVLLPCSYLPQFAVSLPLLLAFSSLPLPVPWIHTDLHGQWE
jgi:hypothetical protein